MSGYSEQKAASMNITNVLKDFKIKENTVLGVFSVSGDFKIRKTQQSLQPVAMDQWKKCSDKWPRTFKDPLNL